MIKCAAKYNNHSQHTMNMNKDDIIELYPHSGENEDWEPIIKYSIWRYIHTEFCKELKKQLRIVKTCNHNKDEVNM